MINVEAIQYDLLKFLINIQQSILRLVDFIFLVFRIFAGTETVRINTSGGAQEEVKLLDYFLMNKTVTTVFFGIVAVASFILIIFTIATVIKNIVTMKKEHTKTMGQMVGSLLLFGLTAFILIISIHMSNEILSILNRMLEQGDIRFSQRLFDIAAEKSWMSGYDINNWNISMTADEIAGVWGNGTPADGLLDARNFNYFVGFVSSIAVLVIAAMAVLGLIKRLFDVVFLFLTSPLIIATIPSDDGAKFRMWREQVISKVVLAYGSVFAFNIFLILINLTTKIEFFLPGSYDGQGEFYNGIVQVLLVIGGALAINGGQILFAQLVGGGGNESQQMTQAALGTLAVGGGLAYGAYGIGKAAKGFLAGSGVKPDGLFSGGALGFTKKLLTGGGRAIGKTAQLMGGKYVANAAGAVKSFAGKIGGGITSKLSSLMSGSGVVGGVAGGVKRGIEASQHSRQQKMYEGLFGGSASNSAADVALSRAAYARQLKEKYGGRLWQKYGNK